MAIFYHQGSKGYQPALDTANIALEPNLVVHFQGWPDPGPMDLDELRDSLHLLGYEVIQRGITTEEYARGLTDLVFASEISSVIARPYPDRTMPFAAARHKVARLLDFGLTRGQELAPGLVRFISLRDLKRFPKAITAEYRLGSERAHVRVDFLKCGDHMQVKASIRAPRLMSIRELFPLEELTKHITNEFKEIRVIPEDWPGHRPPGMPRITYRRR